ncbi:3-dehydroquinate synthase [Robertkochia solimangrovi]|uniref:3-dehydroquinate synthase n=1 Tax=Robertkochia solimangrovi TaxID=2213046 RepID=UPI0011808639|nr:3-dehydroquinate synthase [Robertkochia solimangrovi]TRZ45217.1 3-dehydroquinate synthase [Robertkochia solimangrovi]
MLESIKSVSSTVHFNQFGYENLNNWIAESSYSGIFVLVDENTHEHCLAIFLQYLKTTLPIEVIEVESGEINKQLSTCGLVWDTLSELGADRKALMINLGGGVITDMGGFIASCFMRGIDFVNVPTTLLSMVDASVGGKTGVDLGTLKNQVGLIIEPVMVIIDPVYLNTLPPREMRSGLAEILKHGLIADAAYWERLKHLEKLDASELEGLIHHSVGIKNNVVIQDIRESNLRKILNFGHTLGHAIETYFLKSEDRESLLHGEAIAAGMIMESYLSHELLGLDAKTLDSINETITNYFEKVQISKEDFEQIIGLMKFDKKNLSGNVNFVLLEDIGKPAIDVTVDKSLLINALEYYN